MAAPSKLPAVSFTPMQGALGVGRWLAERFGLGAMWAGDDGFEGVLKQKLSELGVPQNPIELSGPRALTPRQMAEQSGFIKKARPHRRVK